MATELESQQDRTWEIGSKGTSRRNGKTWNESHDPLNHTINNRVEYVSSLIINRLERLEIIENP